MSVPEPPSSLPELAAALRSGQLSLTETLASFEARFQTLEPGAKTFVPEEGRFARLASEARALEARFPEPSERPPLFGVPVGIKDVIHVDGMPTRAGSALPPVELAGAEAEAVTRLRDAGALILGKTASTEFACFAPAATENPRAPGRTPGGSSSGSAAAVAARLAPLTLGTQTIGSISRPAAYCGVVGFKPTSERISRRGVIPVSPTVDHVGPFAEDVAGARLAAKVLLAGYEEAAPCGRALAVPTGPYLERASSAALDHFAGTCERLRAAGYRIVEIPVLDEFERMEVDHRALFDGEAARTHAPWYPRLASHYRAVTVAILERGMTFSDERLEEARAGREPAARALEVALEEHGADLWISPAAPGPPPLGLESTGDPVMNLPWSYTGLPTVSLPAGSDAEGLPVGLQIAAARGRDEGLLAACLGIEEALR